MKTQGFVKLLRKVIREEVRNVIVKELKPILNEVNIKKHDINLQEVLDTPKKPKQPVMKKQYTKNAALNDILNETASTPPEEWNSMNFRSDMAEAFGMQSSNTPLATKGINGERIDMNNEAVATTVNAMTKDYSALMKAIDKKKGM
jgi:hypothetical protein